MDYFIFKNQELIVKQLIIKNNYSKLQIVVMYHNNHFHLAKHFL